MRIAVLTQDHEEAYWQLVRQDPCDYYFFIYDLLMQREKSKVFLALESEQIVGLMLVYENRIVQLRGSQETVGFLLSSLSLSEVEVQAPADCEEMVIARYPISKHKENMTAMCLEEVNENLKVNEKSEKLSFGDAEEVAKLMRESYPLMWSDMTADRVKAMCGSEDNVWYGIRKDGRLVAFGAAILTSNVGLVTWLATLEHHRNKGYCTSILSTLAIEGLKKAGKMMIYVMDDNSAAKRLYMKVGFKQYKAYIFCSV